MARYIDYSTIDDIVAKDRQAVKDALSFVGPTRFKILVRAARDPARPLQWTNMAMAFAGVSGYPFHAFARRYMPAKYEAWINEGEQE